MSQLILNPNFNSIKEKFIQGGTKNLFIVSDFDKTLTKAFVNGKKLWSLLAILRENPSYLGKEYTKEAKRLFEKYAPYENNPDISLTKKKQAMKSWWSEHFNLLINSKLSKKHLEKLINSKRIKLRHGLKKFFKTLKKHNIPLIIISASGIGDAIEMLLKKEKLWFSGLFLITNRFVWSKDGYALKIKQPIIHSLNKDSIPKRFLPSKQIKGRKNLLLLGDSLDDPKMVKNFNYKNLLKIGFLAPDKQDKIRAFKENFDVLLLNDPSFRFVNILLEKITKNT